MTLGSAGYLGTVGIDDGYFPIEYKEKRLRTVLVGVLCVGTYPKDISIKTVTVDGMDGTDTAESIISELNDVCRGCLDLVFIDGVTIAGFNVIDPRKLWKNRHIPVVVIFKHDLCLPRVKEALRKHFADWKERLGIIEEVYGNSSRVWAKWRKLRMSCYGISCSEVAEVVSFLQTVSPMPESLRLADIIASGLTRYGTLLKRINRVYYASSQSHIQSSI